MTALVKVRELVAWGIDENDHRPQLDMLPLAMERARHKVSDRTPLAVADPTLIDVPTSVTTLFSEQLRRTDLQAEMQGLDWRVGIVDLCGLLAFQRRLIFDEHCRQVKAPTQEDWFGLVSLSFGPPVPIAYETLQSDASELLLQTENPNLQILTVAESHVLFHVHGGSPFFEVAEYRGRWFLRDGYHRAYHLLRANVAYVPAVIVHARTLAELGPVQPWFFSEEDLFSSRPPRVTDFLDDDITIEYTRSRLLKTIRVTIRESVEPVQSTTSSGEQ